ncbi:MAG TPA: hypothetical protein VFE50_11065 [Cyclobacteriaceae bacterium]|nr:hypothetical protein [Cyclobacteriaceae bacterium]
MTFLFIVVNLSVIFFLSRMESRRSAASNKIIYWTGLSLRLVGGLAIGIVYQYYYHTSGDTFVFFNDATQLANLFYSDPGAYLEFLATGESPIGLVTIEGRSVFFVAIVSIVNLVTYNNYWLTSLWFSFFSFWSSHRLAVKLDPIAPASRIALLFVPSVIFWTSGIIKESIAFGATAIIVIHFVSLMRNQKLTLIGWVALAVNLYLLLALKYYWGAVLIPCLLTSLIVQWRFRNKKPWVTAGIWILVFTLLSAIASFTHPNFYMERFFAVIVENHDKFVSISRPGNLVEFNNLSASWVSIATNSPLALWSGLFRPMIFEADSLAGIVAAVENLFLLVLVVWKLKSLKMPSPENRLIAMAAIAYIIVLCVFLALSTPNLGTLSRYRVGFLSFFVLIILNDHPLLRIISKWKTR